MSVEPITEEVELLLVNGQNRKVLIRKYLGARQQDKIMQKLTDGLKIKPNQKKEDIEIDAARAMSVISELAEAIWADKNTSIDDVEGESLRNVLMERFNAFLGNLGFKAEAGDNKSG